VVNAADYGKAIAPGTMVGIYGVNLAPRTAAASSVPLPTVLEGMSVEVIDAGQTLNAPLYFVSSGQINIQLPMSLKSASVQVRVRNAQGTSNAETVPITVRAPRLFTRAMDGKGEGLFLHALTYVVVTEAAPAEPGEYLIVYLTGLGAVNPSIDAGKPGGDGAGLGPLNFVTETVMAMIGGRPATVTFAGLAPGFPGVYQVNVQAPADMAEGKPAVIVSAGASVSQPNVWLYAGSKAKPEEVVQKALEAQARGDLAAMTALCDMDAYGAPAKAKANELLETVKRSSTFSDFQFTHLATVMGDQGTLAIVRAKVSFAVATKDGRHSLTHGLLALVRKRGAAWRLDSITPDDMLNQEIFEGQRAKPGNPRVKAAEAVSLETLNAMITQAMKNGYVNEVKLGLAIGMGGVGQVPVYGDALADVYQVLDTLNNTKELMQELWKYGSTGMALLKLKMVGVGILQIATEPIPGLDMQADILQAALEQLDYNLEIARALGELRMTMRGLLQSDVKINPRLFLFASAEHRYPEAFEVAYDETVYHSYGKPIAQIAFTNAEALGKRMPFKVVGELTMSSDSSLYNVAGKLKAELRGGTYYLPVEVGYMAESDASTGDGVLEGYERYRQEGSTARYAAWDVTCRRGVQFLRVRLRNGESTVGIRIVNRYMNLINTLEVEGVGAAGIKIASGERRSGLQVRGTAAGQPYTYLTDQPQCLDMAIADPLVATLTRGKEVTLEGVRTGKTDWKLLLGGSGPEAAIPEVITTIPVEVTGENLTYNKSHQPLFYNDTWTAKVDIAVSTSGSLAGYQEQVLAGKRVVLTVPIQPADSTPSKTDTYTVRVTLSGVARAAGEIPSGYELIVKGQFDSDAITTGSSFEKTIQVQRGSTSSKSVSFSVILYYKTPAGTEQWTAGERLFTLNVVPPSVMN
jgi:uncharacterized protein (TIGR03437 family)